MASLYIHIPFCKQACYYCDFHFSTNTAMQSAMVGAICKEIFLQKDYLGGAVLESIYFGGGTPSMLSEAELGTILATVAQHFGIGAEAEITLEANPDDLSRDKLRSLVDLGINRLSIGIQSFEESHLRYMNRAHSASQALGVVPLAREVGFEDLSIDLIYAVAIDDKPTHDAFQRDLEHVAELNVPHLSAYCLTIEPKTVFGRWQAKGKIKAVGEEFAADQYELLTAATAAMGYEHYEVSNFAKAGWYSRHNTNYWKQGHYLGIGASAHSYNGTSRQYNIANNALYIKSLEKGIVPFEREILRPEDHINEMLMLGLRTQWGCDTALLKEQYAYDIWADSRARELLDFYQEAGLLFLKSPSRICLSERGLLLADEIAERLFLIA